MKTLKPDEILPWLQKIAGLSLRELKSERRRREFRRTLERIRKLSGR